MATHCFASPDERRGLFIDAAARGYVAAIHDFPRYKSQEDTWTAARLESSVLREEVCCIGDENAAYQSLVMCGWHAAYTSLAQLTEREVIVSGVGDLKRCPVDEARSIVRDRFTRNAGLRAEMDRAYAQYLAAVGAA